MPQAVTHILLVLVGIELVRDYFIKNKEKFPIHYVLIGGIAGLLPDIDIIAYWFLYFLGFSLNEVHRTFTHTLFFPLILFAIGILTLKIKSKLLGKHHLKLSMIFIMLAIGSLIHLIFDSILSGYIVPFYPFSYFSFGLNLISLLPETLASLFLPSLDAAILVLWLIHEGYKHKISRFY
jgi:membrane-bound metal-dependent hydrolase YbcI (DUF457 family)